jgi:hypothetical protein
LTQCPATPANPPCVTQIGSNGRINCDGSLPSNNTDLPLSVWAFYYSGGGGISGACGTTKAMSTLLSYPVKSPPAVNSGCPGSQTIDNHGNPIDQLGSGNGWPTIGVANETTIYVCNNTAVSISGNLQVAGPVQFYIQLDSSTNQSFVNKKTPTLAITDGSTVNVSPPAPPNPLPDASLLQIFSNSSGNIGDKSANTFYYGGTIYAPNASLSDAGCQGVYYGAMIVGTLTCNGGPNLTINYDADLANLYGPWSTSGYVQIPPVTIP